LPYVMGETKNVELEQQLIDRDDMLKLLCFNLTKTQDHHRWVLEAGQLVLELLVSWNQRRLGKATWETYDLLAEQFPNFRLEDKAFYRGGSNDTNMRVYTRKKTRVKAGDQVQFNAIFGSWVDPLGQQTGWKNEEEVDENELDKSRDKCPTRWGKYVDRLMEMPRSYPIRYYFKHDDITRKTIEDLIDNHEYNDALRKTRLGKMDRKAYESLPVRPLYDAINVIS
ncbi:hypothetical protein Tco_0420721, partial [Tanacetum coccineum]